MLLYYITDRHQFGGTEAHRRQRLMDKIAEAALAGVDLIQLREKDLSSHDLEHLATDAMAAIAKVASGGTTPARLLINSRIDVALASGAAGVHLPANDLSVLEARNIFRLANRPSAMIGVSCHRVEEVIAAEHNKADLVVFGPVFEKAGLSFEKGLENLRRACNQRPSATASASPQMKIFALGGVTLKNSHKCKEAGADGIAGIRLFQENSVAKAVETLRSNSSPL